MKPIPPLAQTNIVQASGNVVDAGAYKEIRERLIEMNKKMEELIASWRWSAQSLAQVYKDTKHTNPESAERCRVRSEIYAECAIRLES